MDNLLLNRKIKQNRLVFELATALTGAFVIGLFIRLLVFSSFQVADYSMFPALLPGDRILTGKLIRNITLGRWKPGRGELVVFQPPYGESGQSVKKVVAVSGDTISIQDKNLFINGVHAAGLTFLQDTTVVRDGALDPRDNFPPLVIPRPGDTLVFSRLGLRDFDFVLSLAAREPGHGVFSVICSLLVDGEAVGLEQFSSTFGIHLNRDSLPDLNKLPWMHLLSLGNQLQTRFPDKSITFSRSVTADGKRLNQYIVKEPLYFVIGENWEKSHDSRYWGYIGQKAVLSKPLIIYWSREPGAFPGLRLNRFLKLVR